MILEYEFQTESHIKINKFIAFLIIIALFCSKGFASSNNAFKRFVTEDAPIIAFEHANLIDGTGAPAKANYTIVISNGRITDHWAQWFHFSESFFLRAYLWICFRHSSQECRRALFLDYCLHIEVSFPRECWAMAYSSSRRAMKNGVMFSKI